MFSNNLSRILCMLMILYPIAMFSQLSETNKKMNIAVVDFQVQGLEDKEIGSKTANLLIDSLNSIGIYSLIERLSLDKLVSEQKLGLSGLINESTAADIGKFYGVQGVVCGSVMKYGSLYIVTARLVDVKTASILYTGTIKVTSVDALAEKMDEIAVKLCPVIENKTASSSSRSALSSGSSSSAVTESSNSSTNTMINTQTVKQVIRPDYRKSAAWSGLLIPGLPQYQASDNGWGTLYLICGIIGAGMFAGSEILGGIAYNNYQGANNTADADNYYQQIGNCNAAALTGAGLWAASAIIAFLHATFWGPVGPSANNDDFQPINAAMDRKGGIQVSFSERF